MAYKDVKLVDFVPCPTLTKKENSIARKYHYESEVSRIHAAKLIQEAKDEGKPIKVQGKQDV